jgi:hypothetical protein
MAVLPKERSLEMNVIQFRTNVNNDYYSYLRRARNRMLLEIDFRAERSHIPLSLKEIFLGLAKGKAKGARGSTPASQS